MSYQIKFGRLHQFERISSSFQPLLLTVESYNHTLLKAPPISNRDPSWDYKFSFIASYKESLKFYLSSLHPDSFMHLLGQGTFNIRQFVDKNNLGNAFEAKIPIFMSYENDVYLQMQLSFREEARSRNEGICEIPSINKKLQIQNYQNSLKSISKQNNEKSEVSFFKGPCQSRNLFSMMDPVYKGQTFTFIEPLKR